LLALFQRQMALAEAGIDISESHGNSLSEWYLRVWRHTNHGITLASSFPAKVVTDDLENLSDTNATAQFHCGFCRFRLGKL
jgi:hypothetical protein